MNPSIELRGSDVDLVESALAFLRSYGRQRWFLYLHMMDVHQYVYDSDSALFGTTYSDIYDNSIRRADGLIGVILEELRKQKLRQRTMIVLISDHGEAFYEHGHEGHARDLYGETIRTPFLIGLPFRLEEGLVVESSSQNVDVWPTILDLLGMPALTVADGRSLLPDVLAETEVPEDGRILVAHLDRTWGKRDLAPRPIVSITMSPYRLIYPDPGNLLDHVELYDLESDPLERHDLANIQTGMVDELSRHAERYLEDQSAPWGDEERVELDDLHLRQLRALGYVIE
jgi:arylsulfatase A-like enzyme